MVTRLGVFLHFGHIQPPFCPPSDFLLQLSLPRKTPLWRRRSRRSGRAGATETWPRPLSLRCPTSSILLGEEWRVSWTTRWPSVSQQRSWRPGICWPAATTTSSTSAWGWRSCGGWAWLSVMASCCLSGIGCTFESSSSSSFGKVWVYLFRLFASVEWWHVVV